MIMNDRNDFRKYAVRHLGMDGLTIDEESEVIVSEGEVNLSARFDFVINKSE